MEKYIVKNAGKVLNLPKQKPDRNLNQQQSVDGMPLPVVVTQPANQNKPVYVNQRAKFSRNYCMSIYGVVRIAIILSQIGGLLAIACAPVLLNGRFYIPPDFAVTRDVYLFFSITGFLIAILYFILFSFNMDQGWFFNKLPMALIVIGTDILWMIPMFILGITSAIREVNLTDPLFYKAGDIRIGTFAAGAALAFLSALLYGMDIVLYVYKSVHGGVDI